MVSSPAAPDSAPTGGPPDQAGAGSRMLGPPSLPAIGLAMAALLAIASWRVHPWPVLGATAWFVVCGVPLTFIDIRLHRLPDLLTGPAFAGVVLCLTVAAATSGHWASLGRAVLGGAALGGAYLAAALVSAGHVGLGDSKAAVLVGTLMGWFSWGTVLAGTIMALLIAAACGVALLATRRATMQTQLAYGPALIGGALVAVLLTAHAG
jgi:leader peptidase (prepilin peptidase) / N-methyltransferase